MGRFAAALQHAHTGPIAILTAAMTASACGGGPTSASPSVKSLTVTCPAQLLVGQSLFCSATAELASGSSVYMKAGDINWISSNVNVASTGYAGLIKGQSGGPVRISGVYGGVSGSADVTVLHQDVLECSNTLSYQGEMKVGTTATIWVQGFYGVESAPGGQLSMQVTNQNGDVVAGNAPLAVARGGDSFVMSTVFTIPAGATKLCRMVLLQIGTTTLSSVPSLEEIRCVSIRP